MNTVVSTTKFTKLMKEGSNLFNSSVLVTIVPDAGSDLEKQLMLFISNGGKIIIYGPSDHASDKFLSFMNIQHLNPLSGVFQLKNRIRVDQVPLSGVIRHDAQMSGGGIQSVVGRKKSDTRVLTSVVQDNQQRDVVVMRQDPAWKGGAVCYVRGTNSATYTGSMLLSNDNPDDWFIGGSLMRYALSELLPKSKRILKKPSKYYLPSWKWILFCRLCAKPDSRTVVPFSTGSSHFYRY